MNRNSFHSLAKFPCLPPSPSRFLRFPNLLCGQKCLRTGSTPKLFPNRTPRCLNSRYTICIPRNWKENYHFIFFRLFIRSRVLLRSQRSRLAMSLRVQEAHAGNAIYPPSSTTFLLFHLSLLLSCHLPQKRKSLVRSAPSESNYSVASSSVASSRGNSESQFTIRLSLHSRKTHFSLFTKN